MAASVFDRGLTRHPWSTGEPGSIFSDENRIRKGFRYEAPLAQSQSALGIVPQAVADDLEAHARVGAIDLEAVADGMRMTWHPLVPALRALQHPCLPEQGEWLHDGPTTQDVLDIGTVLQLHEVHALFRRDLAAVGREVYRLAQAHRDTPMAGCTHAVQALPITCGHKCAVCLPNWRAMTSGWQRSNRACSPAAWSARGHPGFVRSEGLRTRGTADAAARRAAAHPAGWKGKRKLRPGYCRAADGFSEGRRAPRMHADRS